METPPRVSRDCGNTKRNNTIYTFVDLLRSILIFSAVGSFMIVLIVSSRPLWLWEDTGSKLGTV